MNVFLSGLKMLRCGFDRFAHGVSVFGVSGCG